MALQYRNILSLSVSFSPIIPSRISHSRHDWARLKREREGEKREHATAANDSCIVSQGANWLISGFKCHLFSLPPDIVLKEPQFNLCLCVHCTHTHTHTCIFLLWRPYRFWVWFRASKHLAWRRWQLLDYEREREREGWRGREGEGQSQ